jgi:threonine dehydratase
MDVETISLPTLDSVREAAKNIQGVANRTPVMTSRTLDELVGARVFLKCENYQRAGAFKFRGAYNALSKLSEGERKNGVLTYSSGNHAQAIALAGRLLGIRTTIIMPTNAPAAKLAATRGYGAEVILFDPDETKREELAAKLREERGEVAIIPPYDHVDVVAGQGTAALELFDEVGELDEVFAPCGGGGLLSGTALTVKGIGNGCRVIGVEPELADDATRSFHTGTLQKISNPPTIADGLRTPYLGKITFPLVRENVDDMITVTESEIVDAMKFLWTRMKVVVEPSGAVSLAGVIKSRGDLGDHRVGVILSGGNVDMETAFKLFNGEVQ